MSDVADSNSALLELRAILENATVGILFSRNRKLVQANPVCAQMFGYAVDEMRGLSGRALYPTSEVYESIGRDAGPALAAGQPFRTEIEMARKDGSTFLCRMSAKAVNPRRPQAGTIWILEDVTEWREAERALQRAKDELEQRVLERTNELTVANEQLQKEIFERVQAEQRIWHVAHHDALTGLPNRTLLHDRLEQGLAQALRDNHRVGVMFLDLDRFKSINDSLGHPVGDELLKQVAVRLGNAVRAVDTVSRLGGDEFIIVLRELAGPDDAVLVAEKILKALAAPVTALGHDLRVTPSIGISVYPDDGTEVLQLMKNADTAMYHAKASGRNNFQFFAPRMNEEATRFFQIEHQLRHALDAGELLLHYQPQVRLAEPSVCGLEALVRWQHPEAGMMQPAEFVPVAEETGLILPLGEWVLGEALRQNRQWQEVGYPKLPVSVNLSPRQFRQKGLVDNVRRMLAETNQPAKLLELEITETSLMHDVDEGLDTLRELSAMGVRLAIDDFGIGYSSLNHLKRFPVHRLKIDRSFVSDLGVDWDDAAIVSAIVSLARALNLETLAEGVETSAQLKILLSYGCTRFQGNYFSAPLPASESAAIFRSPVVSA
jgi:diguanylate cyclase (GGDEF)-like protein/PAS domain S-box-containing protein